MTSPYAGMLMDMGFSKEKVEKALQVTGNQGVEPAMEWLLAHAEELDQQQEEVAGATCGSGGSTVPIVNETTDGPESSKSPEEDSTVPNEEAKSLKCEDCGKLFKSSLEVQYHAAKSGHSNFSESTEEKKPLSEEERQEQLKLLESKIKEKRKEREEKEKLEALEREKNRIKSGKEMIAAKKKMDDEEIRKAVELRKREKEEDRLARQKVRDQIEADKLARKAKQNQAASGGVAQPPISPPTVEPPKLIVAPPKDYSKTRLQIRLTNGQALTQSFGAKEQLSAVRLFVEMNRTDEQGPFSLMTNFPKKVFTEDDFDKPLDILGLVPSAVIIVSKSTI